jgi:hypothetical protein
MKKFINLLKTDKIIKWGTLTACALLVFTTAYVLFFYFSLPPLIPLFNQMPWGSARLGTKIEVFLPIAIAIIFFTCNLFFITRLYERMPLLSRMLSVTTFLITLLTFIFMIRSLQLIL